MSYAQLTQKQRHQMSALLKTDHSHSEIIIVLGANKSIFSREVHGNRGNRGCWPKQAHRLAMKRRSETVQQGIQVKTQAWVDKKVPQD